MIVIYRVKTFVKPKIKTSTASNGSGTNNPKPPRKLKVELSTLRISEDSEKLLYETLKQVCGEVNNELFFFLFYKYIFSHNYQFKKKII